MIVAARMTLAVLAVAVLTGCAALAAPAPAPAAARGARLWIIRDPIAILAALPPHLPAVSDPPAPADPLVVAGWAQPAGRWMRAELSAIRVESTAPPRAARALMLLGVALNDGLIVADAARAHGFAVADDAVLAEAAWRVLAANHPLRADVARADADMAAWAGAWRGEDHASAVAGGRLLGAAVADAVLAWAAQDGSAGLDPTFAPGDHSPGRWRPTPPSFQEAQEPAWGAVETVIIGDPAGLRAPAPPAWDSPAMRAEAAAFARAQAQLSADDIALARFWRAGAGTATPAGMWVELADGQIGRAGMAPRQAAAIYAALGVALHDAGVACWESKYHYQLARPIQWMREASPQWSPLFATPPHPSYPSGHACFSGAGAGVLAAAFPADAAAFERQAADAARSRVLAGIHWPMDGAAGLELGRAVAARAVEAAKP